MLKNNSFPILCMTYKKGMRVGMKNLVTGMFLGAIIGGAIGTMASDEINDFRKTMMKKGKKIMKKF
ncbi:MAG: hypothetical protein IJ215_03375 [Clostridia bacterium]|nr:hypothetical protein [Clostridia bacterium]